VVERSDTTGLCTKTIIDPGRVEAAAIPPGSMFIHILPVVSLRSTTG